MRKTDRFNAALIGLSADALGHCTQRTRRNTGLIAFSMMLTSTVSAGLASAIIAGLVLRNWAFAPVAFVVWFLLVYTLERLLILAERWRLATLVRGLAVLTFAVMHMVLFEILVHDRDIEERYRVDRRTEAQQIRHRYEPRLNLLAAGELRQEERYDSLQNLRLTLHQQLIDEANGQGGSRQRGRDVIYETTAENVAPMLAAIDSSLANVQAQRAALAEESRLLAAGRDAEIGQLPAAEDIGLVRRIDLLGALVAEGSLPVKLMAVFWFLVFCFLEGLPLFCKWFLNLTEYEQMEKRMTTDNLTVFEQQAQQKLQTSLEEIVWTYRRRRLDRQRQGASQELETMLAEVREMFDHEMSFLTQMMAEEEKWTEDLPAVYAQHVEGAVNRALRRFEEVLSPSSSSRRPPFGEN